MDEELRDGRKHSTVSVGCTTSTLKCGPGPHLLGSSILPCLFLTVEISLIINIESYY